MKPECERCEVATHFIKKGRKEGYEEVIEALEKFFEKVDGVEDSVYVDAVDDCI